MKNESITLKDVFTINDRDTSVGVPIENRWTKIGIGFVNRDNSINVILDAIPLNGRLQIRDRAPKQQAAA